MFPNKKIISITLIALLIIISLVAAEQSNIEGQVNSGVESLEDRVQQTRDGLNTLDETKGEFLGKEWTTIFRENKAFSWIYKLDPFFKFFIGQEFSISWKFLTGLLIWLVVLFTILGSLDAVFKNKLFNISVGTIMSGLISQLAVPFIIDKATELLKKGSEKAAIWINFANILILICLIIVAHKGTKALKKYLAQRRLNKRVQRAEEAVTAVDKSLSKAEAVKKGMEEEVEERTTKDEF